VDHHEVIVADPAQSPQPALSVMPPVVLRLDQRPLEQGDDVDEIDAMVGGVLPSLAFVPLELQALRLILDSKSASRPARSADFKGLRCCCASG
jgi:hypothetical protein